MADLLEEEGHLCGFRVGERGETVGRRERQKMGKEGAATK
jgi:hypothetical protein